MFKLNIRRAKVVKNNILRINDLKKIKNFYSHFYWQIRKIFYRINTSSENFRVILDAIIVFTSIVLSTIMRMGYGIFEYSFVSLILNSLVCSLVTGAVFLKFKIDNVNWKQFSIHQIGSLLVGVVTVDLLSFPLVMLMDKHDCLSSSIMFINFFVMTVLLLIPRLLCKEQFNNQLSDIFVGNPTDISPNFGNMISTCSFNPLGFIVTGTETDVKSSQHYSTIPVLGKLTNVESILNSLQAQKINPRRIVVIGPINSNELEILKSYTTQNGIVLLQLFSK